MNRIEKIFIIAEAGVNHNGNLDTAKEMVDAAKEAGADAVKFQTFKTEELVSRSAELAAYQRDNVPEAGDMQFDMLKKLELSQEDFKEIKEYCDEKEIMFLSTPFDIESADFLDELMPIFKISSGDVTNIPFLEHIAKKGKPIILSTGMSTLEEVKRAVEAIKDGSISGYPALSLLHCTTSYPCSIEEVNLDVVNTLREETGLQVGYSDHTEGIETAASSAGIAAISIFEKHFTLDRNMHGPDHKASLDLEGLKLYVNIVRKVETLRSSEEKETTPESTAIREDLVIASNGKEKEIKGNREKNPTKSEIDVMKVVRKSIVAAEDLKEGEVITEDMIKVKRPGTGIQPFDIGRIIGMRLSKNKKQDDVLSWEDIK